MLGALATAGVAIWGGVKAVRSVTDRYVTGTVCRLVNEGRTKELTHIEERIRRIDTRLDTCFAAVEKLTMKVLNGRRSQSDGS